MFFTYYQNNSGGSFVGPHFVIIEADSNSEADYIAENHPDSGEEPSFLVIRKQVKTSEDLRAKIELILANSDIVWTKYGTETIADLTEKILKAVRNE